VVVGDSFVFSLLLSTTSIPTLIELIKMRLSHLLSLSLAAFVSAQSLADVLAANQGNLSTLSSAFVQFWDCLCLLCC